MNHKVKMFLVYCLAVATLSCSGKGVKPSLEPPGEEKISQAALTQKDPDSHGEKKVPHPNPAQKDFVPGANTLLQTDVTDVPSEGRTESLPTPENNHDIKKDTFKKYATTQTKKKSSRDAVEEIVIITSPGTVNVRSGPGLDYAVIGRSTGGENFEFSKKSTETYKGKPWYEILDKSGRKAYVWSGLSKKLKERNKGFGSNRPSPFAKIKTRDILTPPLPEDLRKTKEISLNFESVDIREIIQTFSELLKLDYIIERGISGNITLHTSNKIPVRNLFKMLEQILALNNIAIIKKGDFYHFLPMPEAKRKPIGIYHGTDKNSIPDEDRLIIQIIPLRYIPSKSLKAMVAPLLSKNAHFINLETTNTLIVVELASNMRRLVELIGALDVNTIENTDLELYTISYSDALEISKNLQQIFSNLGYKSKGPLSLKFVPLKRLNSILVVNTFPNLLETVEYWIKKLDQPMVKGQTATYVYYLQNAEADKVGSILKGLYAKKKTRKDLEKERRTRRAQEENRSIPKRTLPPARQPKGFKRTIAPQPKINISQELGFGEVEGEVIILADKDTNSLIIRTDPKNYPAIEETIEKLDLMPLQVLIEVMIMDVLLDETTSFGIEWALKGKIGTDWKMDAAQGGPAGLSKAGEFLSSRAGSLGFLVGNLDTFMGMLKASGLESKANVLSNPVIITSENKPATISITDQIPVQTASLVNSTGGAPITQETIEYKDVGIKLTVKPKINDERFVNMEISQEVSNVTETGTLTPRFSTRSATTNVVVKDKETIVLGGLMETRKSKTKSGIPYLSKIPIFGRLFGAETETIKKSELLIFITPHVITNYKESRTITREFREKLKLLKEETKNIKIGDYVE